MPLPLNVPVKLLPLREELLPPPSREWRRMRMLLRMVRIVGKDIPRSMLPSLARRAGAEKLRESGCWWGGRERRKMRWRRVWNGSSTPNRMKTRTEKKENPQTSWRLKRTRREIINIIMKWKN